MGIEAFMTGSLVLWIPCFLVLCQDIAALQSSFGRESADGWPLGR